MLIFPSSYLFTDRICATTQFTSQCNSLQRGNSEVSCVYVQDAIECAQQIRNATATSAHFGVFNAETALQLSYLGWDGLVVLKELRHVDRIPSGVDYQSVVVVKNERYVGGIENTRGMRYCHPGLHYTRSQRWSEEFLKSFERNAAEIDCNLNKNATTAEMETAALSKFFQGACRPGTWSTNEQEDAYLSK